MALVWFVDKFPRSRKPVQYRRLEDIMASEAGLKSLQRPRHDDLLPIILPCALCCSKQQMSTSVIANELMKQRTNGKLSSSTSGGGGFARSRSLERGRRRSKVNKQLKEYDFGGANNIINNNNNSDTNINTDYNDFLQLCEHVECLVQQSMAQISSSSSDQDQLMIPKHYSKDTTSTTKNNQLVMEDDLRLRSLRDANRSPSPEKRPPTTITSTRGHYAWLQNRPNNTQCSKIL